ncbi:unnamed protein product [Pleuronectes platessa]|uniref:Uncharacterized protein n=1 Tax=Pleuronectes platessa TaxID=8262 RepID=A0A9N7TSB1_PLEPL|nr:unnamed protein product [Pleuronectes platessa]
MHLFGFNHYVNPPPSAEGPSASAGCQAGNTDAGRRRALWGGSSRLSVEQHNNLATARAALSPFFTGIDSLTDHRAIRLINIQNPLKIAFGLGILTLSRRAR